MKPERIDELLGLPRPDERGYRPRFDADAEARGYATRVAAAPRPMTFGPIRLAGVAAATGAVVLAALMLPSALFGPHPASPTPLPVACAPTTTVAPSGLVPLASAAVDPAALAAFRAKLAELGGSVPSSGWSVLEVSTTKTVFVAPSSPSKTGYVFVEVERGAGDWAATAYGDCNPGSARLAGWA